MVVPWYLMAQGTGGGETKTASGPVVTFRGDGSSLLGLTVSIEPVQSGSGNPSPDNVRPISGHSAVKVWVKPTHDTTADPTATIQLGQTVYGGTLDVKNGVLTVDKGMVLLSVSANVIGTGTTAAGVNYASVAYSKVGISLGGGKEVISSDYTWYPASATAAAGMIKTYAENFRIYDQRFTSATAAAPILDNVQVVYPLATPITIPLTPTEISTLQGKNNVWADTGDVMVEYAESGNPALMKLAVAFMGEE